MLLKKKLKNLIHSQSRQEETFQRKIIDKQHKCRIPTPLQRIKEKKLMNLIVKKFQ